jgi:hypothetical protein
MTRRRVGKRKVIRTKAAPTRFIVARDVLSQAPHVATLWLGDPHTVILVSRSCHAASGYEVPALP